MAYFDGPDFPADEIAKSVGVEVVRHPVHRC
jgi:hypothetical protein